MNRNILKAESGDFRLKPGSARFRLDLNGAFIRKTDLSYANLADANFSNADCTNVNFKGANFRNTNLTGTILIGADLTDAKNLTVEQLASAVLDATTKLPDYISYSDIQKEMA